MGRYCETYQYDMAGNITVMRHRRSCSDPPSWTRTFNYSETSQIEDGGRLVAIVGRPPTSRAMLYRSVAGDLSGWPIFDAGAPLLPGFAEPPAFVF